MSRKHVAVVIMLVLAPVVGGATATFGATANDADRAQASPADVAVQDQPVNNTTVALDNQTTDGTVVTVSQVTLTEGGFVAIHNQSLLNGSVLDSVLGSSEYLEAGTYENVTVQLEEPITESQSVLALAYQDTDGDQDFDFVSSQGQQDSPYSVDNQVVADSGFVTVQGAPETTTTTTTEEVTPTETTTTEEVTPTETTTTEQITTAEPGETVDEQLVTYQFDFVVDQFSMIVGEGEPERVVTVEDRVVRNETVLVDFTALMAGASVDESLGSLAAEGPEPSAADLQTVRVVAQNVTLDNASFVVVGPAGVPVEIDENETSELGAIQTTTVETTTTTEAFTTTAQTTTEAPLDTTTVIETTTETTAVETTFETTVDDVITTTEALTTETTTIETTTTEQPAEAGESLRVSAITVPGTVVLNDQPLVATAKIQNPTDETVTDTVQFRVGGTVVETQIVKLDPGETLELQFSASKDRLDVPPGESFVGVLTRGFGKSVNITVVEPEATTVEA